MNAVTASAVLPTLYEYYTQPTITTGLSDSQSYFTLNNKNISIYSGSLHYFRVPKQYWRDRLRKFRAAGLNTVETYVPWNLHEYQDGKYDFGNGGSDMENFLDIKEFLTIAKEEDLFSIVRPGPFICAEFEFGGLPSWLLRQKNIKFRTSNEIFMKYVTRYFNLLLPILAMLQFTKGGPILALQVENEYGSTERKGFVPDKYYLQLLRQLYIKNGIVELLVTSDSPTAHGTAGTLPGVFLQTANFGSNPEPEFDKLKTLQKNKPTMSMEFWTGWFDHWSEKHHTRDDDDFEDNLERILKYPASVNMYMFHGGTSWGFLNGANLANPGIDNSGFQPDTTSYDYDAPLSEAGDYTEKYVIVKELLAKYNNISTRIPITPTMTTRVAYPTVKVVNNMLLDDILSNLKAHPSQDLLSMEQLPINNNSGQSYGYIAYRKTNFDIPANSILTIKGHVCDTVVVMVNGVLISKPLTRIADLNKFGFWRLNNSKIALGSMDSTNATLDLVVENWGRNNFGYLEQFFQFKGLWQGDVYLNDNKLSNWDIFPLEFKKSWNHNLSRWRAPIRRWAPGPSLYKFEFTITDIPSDTYVGMSDWTKGIVIVNDFVLGRYSQIGPQQRLYLPGPFLQRGVNTILVFEYYMPANEIKFYTQPFFKTPNRRTVPPN